MTIAANEKNVLDLSAFSASDFQPGDDLQPREKEFPQPQDEVALGFLMAKEAPIISST